MFAGSRSINSLRNKITDVSVFMQYVQLDYFVVSETKLDNSFLSAQFMLSNYGVRARKNRDKNGVSIILKQLN